MPATSHRDNSFDALRLVAAVTVVVAHAWPLTGLDDSPSVGGIRLFHLAVYVFFSLSGFLVATSWMRDGRAGPFLIRRASRIFPALLVLVLLTVLVIGPIATTLRLGEYLASPTTWGYLGNATLVATYELPGVFETHPRPVVNGSLWTLGPEFLCYLGVLAVGLLVLRAGVRPWIAPAVFGALAIGLGWIALSGAELGGWLPALKAMVFFALGALIATLRLPRLPLWPAAVLVVIWIAGALLAPGVAILWGWLGLPYLVLALGTRSAPVVRAAGRFGDVSYGVYLWGWPVQQLVVQFLPGLPLWVDIPLVVAVTLALGFASWHLVERHALDAGRRLASARR